MKIAIVADVLGEENNGTTTACMNLVRYLRSQGDEVRIICPDADKKGMPGYYVLDTVNLGSFLNRYIASNGVSIAKPSKKIIEEAFEGVDLVHIMIPLSSGFTAAKIASKKSIPLTAGFHAQAENVTNHIFLMNSHFANWLVYQIFYKGVYSKVDAIHYPTLFIRETFEGAIGKETNGYVISNGVQSRFHPKKVDKPAGLENKYIILFSGRYSKEKSHKILLKAIKVSKHEKDIQLIFAGQGPQEKKIRHLAKRLQINEPIMKYYTKDELVDVINYSDLYCHPAEIEIEAVSCLEAISCGLVPVISDSKRSATRFFALDDLNQFKCNNFKHLAKRIDYWIEHPIEKTERSQRYLGYTKQFAQEECMRKMREMMIETIKKKKASQQ